MLKKVWIIFLAALLLCGCGAEETFETVADELVQPVMAQPRQIAVNLPDNAVAPVLESNSEQMYLCQDYEILMEIVDSGDLDATIRRASGYDKSDLTVLQTQSEGIDRYEFVWTCIGETGHRLGQGVVLDDGNYHYVMTVLRDADSAEDTQIVWNEVFRSFTLV